MIRCTHCQGRHESVAQVRECAIGATVERRNTRSTRHGGFKAPTEKQINFLRSLARKTFPEGADAYVDKLVRDASREQVSEEIDRLKTLVEQAQQGKEERTEEAPEGIHALEQEDGSIWVYKVQVAHHGSGKKYAKELDTGSGRWEYAGRKPLHRMSEDTLMTREQAERFGALYGMCGVCGATLTDEDSIERGIGPVCAGRF